MAASVNRVILIGNIGKDPDVRSLQDGSKVVSFSLATSESWTDRASGERKEKTEWHRIVVMGNDHLTKLAADRLHKGSKIYVEGRLQTRKWEKDGVERFVTEILLGRFGAVLTLLDARSDDRPDNRDGYHNDGNPSRGTTSGNTSGRTAEPSSGTAHRGATARHNTSFGGSGSDLDDEIPF